MSEYQKIIDFKGIKYYLKDCRWYRLTPIINDNVLADNKTETPVKISLPQENLLDVFKLFDFDQLLSFQETSLYFKNIIDKYGKELARKKFATLKFRPVSDLKLDKVKLVTIIHEYKFIETPPNLYDLELSEHLEQKWRRGIEESIPMFLTSFQHRHVDTIICELGQNCNGKEELHRIQLPKFPQNVEQMAIARYLFKLLFNCVFEYFEISFPFNPKMIQLLFDETTDLPLQIHSQRAKIFIFESVPLKFILNHLVSKLDVDIDGMEFDVEDMYCLFKILAEGGNKFSNISYTRLDSEFYNYFIEQIVETPKDISKMVNEIKFYAVIGPLNSSKKAKNIHKALNYKKFIKKFETTKFQLVNEHNSKIKFSVYTEERDVPFADGYMPVANIVIKRIFN